MGFEFALMLSPIRFYEIFFVFYTTLGLYVALNYNL